MAELTPMDRLQPCLLDRLTDDEPQQSKESRDKRVVSMRRYKAAVLRDLEMLLNSKSHPLGDEIYEYEVASRSVLNYGIPDLCGVPVLNISSGDVEARVKRAVLDFEPRILGEAISVRMIRAAESSYVRTISFEIEGHLWAQPSPDHLLVKTEVDLETGRHSLRGDSGG